MEKIEKGKTTQPQIGTWDKLPKEETEKKPKIEFVINLPKEVVFITNEPREYQGETGAYYVFDVEENKEKKVIMTSAWSLLRALKLMTPLTGKKCTITKKMDKGKQYFDVKETKNSFDIPNAPKMSVW